MFIDDSFAFSFSRYFAVYYGEGGASKCCEYATIS